MSDLAAPRHRATRQDVLVGVAEVIRPHVALAFLWAIPAIALLLALLLS